MRKTSRNFKKGYAELMIAFGLLTVSAIASFTSTLSARSQMNARSVVINTRESFYAGEIIALINYFTIDEEDDRKKLVPCIPTTTTNCRFSVKNPSPASVVDANGESIVQASFIFDKQER